MFSSFFPPINYPSINPPVIRLPDLDVDLGSLGDQFKKKSQDSALTLAKFLVDVNIKTDLKQQLEPLIQDAFNKLESFLKDIASVAENLLGKSKAMLEDLIKQALKGLSDLLEDVEKRVSNILSEAKLLAEGIIDKVKTDLLDGFFDRVDSLRKDLINDLKKLIQDAKQAGEDLLYKGDKIVTGTITSLKDDIDKLASDLEEQLDIRKWFDPDIISAQRQEEQREDFCKNRIGATGIAFSTLGSAQFYEYRQCITLKRLNDVVELSGGKVTIRNMKLVYADLNDRAWKLACVGRAEGSALQDIALADWIKFGQLFQLWNQFENNMEVLEVINQRMEELQKEIDTVQARSKELDEKISTFQKKSDQIDALDSAVQQAQAKANTADATANTAVGLAHSAQATASSAQSTADQAINRTQSISFNGTTTVINSPLLITIPSASELSTVPLTIEVGTFATVENKSKSFYLITKDVGSGKPFDSVIKAV